MDSKYVNELIEKAVQGYKTTCYKYLDEVKTLVFTYLLNGFTYEEFEDKLEALNFKYFKTLGNKEQKGYKQVAKRVKTKDLKADGGTFEISEDELNELKFKLDMNSPLKAREKFDKVIKRYYRTTKKTLQKEYVQKDTYLSQSLTKYDKVEKVVPYYSQATGEIVSYQDIATYNSMIYNVNLTSTAWNATFESCKELDEDIVYVEPHPLACPHCQAYQGKFYSVTGKTPGYPKLDAVLWQNGGGLKHPNCKHVLTTYVGQEETNLYSGSEWVEKYEAKQKENALKLKKSRLETDKAIYKELGNQKMVDKTDQKLNKVESQIIEWHKKAKIKS